MDCVYAKDDFMNYCREAEELLKMDFGRKQPSKKEITKCAVDMEIMDRNAAMAILQDYISEYGKYIVITQDAPKKIRVCEEKKLTVGSLPFERYDCLAINIDNTMAMVEYTDGITELQVYLIRV